MSDVARLIVKIDGNVLFVLGAEKHNAGEIQVQKKNDEVLLDVEGADWLYSAQDLREIADAMDRYKALALAWKQGAKE